MEKWLVGVDVGGTNIKFAFLSDDGDIVYRWSIPTDVTNDGQNIIPDIASSILHKLHENNQTTNNVKGIGIGAPAFMNMETGFIFEAINLGWKDIDIKSELERRLMLPVVIDNDANVAAIGEMWKGAGIGSKDLLCITIGTGIGGGIIINGEIVHGTNGMAGEIGHITVNLENGILCNCGKYGCLETKSSATGMVQQAIAEIDNHPESLLFISYKQTGQLTAKMIVQAALEKDEYALKIVDTSCYYLGLAIANIANTINPSRIVIGGGVSKAGSLLLNSIQKYFNQFALPRVKMGADLAIATLGNDAGVIGAAWLVKNKL
ncbi:glucokinase [Schinkia azotoformans MEV2011]|uniref:Glucokinase n=2 Tax=Schinkia azotoformans TaxID=1454 RepID=K6DT86_SCHAZ|nr:ROK family glucokinase [Schinkia azotoformans]EKN63976.1 glucose kinase [Schinkia azotoformans LMG 9581]KEF38726.1 glucokinase [Schinkia azotoformans MEV2011]MEC1640589.1 ROK family glucokinase [Schinkia azotoformans]MEC1697045.1 ROK family glucokinase [Schinkia azotoformans]MEC1718084.1 ROK family glucokinase [Schinkia azotoformans]